MNTLKNSLSFALIAVSMAGAAAHAANGNPNDLPKLDVGVPMTSQQVQQELATARAAGLLNANPNALPRLQRGEPKSSAQIQQELSQAYRAGLKTNPGTDATS